MKYTEKADIAAKAVKVLDSVTMRRQEKTADRYYSKAMGMLSGEIAQFECVAEARSRMKRRLNKPRYTLKDGEWVRKGYEHGKIKILSEIVTEDRFRTQRDNLIRQSNDIAMMQANANKALYGPQSNSIVGGY